MRRFLSLLLLILACGQLAHSAHAEKRVALVIGNNAYRNLSDKEQLHNAVSDAQHPRERRRNRLLVKPW